MEPLIYHSVYTNVLCYRLWPGPILCVLRKDNDPIIYVNLGKFEEGEIQQEGLGGK